MKKTLLISLAFTAVMCVNAQTVVFHETFNQFTEGNPASNALTSDLTDETGYVVGGGGAAMTCTEAGKLSLVGGRFETKKIDLTGENVVLTVIYKVVVVDGQDTKRFQIDIDKTGTSGMGTLFAENQGASVEAGATTAFVTKTLLIENGTAESYIHFRTESSHTVLIDEIKVTKGGTSAVQNTETVKEVKSVLYFNVFGQEVSADTKGWVVVKKTFIDGTSNTQKIFKNN